LIKNLTPDRYDVLVLFMDEASRSPEAASDPFEARAQQRVEVLRELTAIGLDMAREVRRQLMEPVAEEAPAKDLGLMFARIARAVRQTAALAARLDQDRQKSRAETASKAAAETRLRGVNRKLRVQDIVERVLDTESERERLLERLDERLEDANDTDFADRPIGELVAAICRDLGVTPDWGLWEDEDWAIEALAAEPAPPDQRPETYLPREAGEGDRSP
jgi:hypothetical protein